MCWQVAAVKGDYQHKQESGTFFGEQYQHMLSALASSASTWVSLPSPNTCKLMPCRKALTLVCTADRLCQTAWVRTGAGMRCLEAVGKAALLRCSARASTAQEATKPCHASCAVSQIADMVHLHLACSHMPSILRTT